MIQQDLHPSVALHSSVLLIGSGRISCRQQSEIRAYSILEMSGGILELGLQSVLGYQSFLQLTGTIIIGDGCVLGPKCTYIASSHPINDKPFIGQGLTRGKIIIGNNVWLGANCTINSGVSIGDNSIVGANSFVNKDVPSNSIYAGTPAKLIRKR